jgi:hypothetical protein
MIVAIGPVANVPSWNWVGIDAIDELSKYCQVEIFNNFNCLPGASVIIVIKQLPPREFMQAAYDNHKSVIFVPIDFFMSEEHIRSSASILRQCKLILSHADSLIPLLQVYSPTYPLEHSGKYILSEGYKYKISGYVLWIGGYQFVPYMLSWLRKNPMKELVFCTDYNNKRAIAKAEEVASYMRVPMTDLKRYEMYEWAEDTQLLLMTQAKAAIDIKGNDFSQHNKPPTKGQQFIASGIPFAINKGNNCYNYFQSKGFNVCTPNETNRWFSEAYAKETWEFGKKLRNKISATTIGLQIKQYIELIKTTDSESSTIGFVVHHN